MSILKLAPASVIQESGAEAVDQLKETSSPLAADSRELFDSTSIIVNGTYAGKPVVDYLSDTGWQALGSDAQGKQSLPFTVRDLGTGTHSVFYSPAKKHQAYWLVLDAPENGVIYFGQGVSEDGLEAALKDGSYKTELEPVSAEKNDLFVIDPGTAYVFEKGLKILEIESTESSASSDAEQPEGHDYHKGDWVADGQAEHVCAGRNDVFELDFFQVDGRLDMDTDSRTCKVLVFLEGSAVVDDHNETIHCQQESVLLVPAETAPFHITGNCMLALIHLV